MELLNGLTKQAFEEWLTELPVAPYLSMFDTIPTIIQIAYIQAFLREELKYHAYINPYGDGLHWSISNIRLNEQEIVYKSISEKAVKLFANYEGAAKEAIVICNNYHNLKHSHELFS